MKRADRLLNMPLCRFARWAGHVEAVRWQGVDIIDLTSATPVCLLPARSLRCPAGPPINPTTTATPATRVCLPYTRRSPLPGSLTGGLYSAGQAVLRSLLESRLFSLGQPRAESHAGG